MHADHKCRCITEPNYLNSKSDYIVGRSSLKVGGFVEGPKCVGILFVGLHKTSPNLRRSLKIGLGRREIRGELPTLHVTFCDNISVYNARRTMERIR